MSKLYYESGFSHHGILGMKWGVRRYQDRSGRLTSLGKSRYQNRDGSLTNEGRGAVNKYAEDALQNRVSAISPDHRKQLDTAFEEYSKVVEPVNKLMSDSKLTRKFGMMAAKKFFESDDISDDVLRDFVGSDMDYGPDSTVALYYKSIGIPYSKLHDSYAKAFNNLSSASNQVTNDILNTFGYVTMSSISMNEDARIEVNSLINKKAFKNTRFNL